MTLQSNVEVKSEILTPSHTSTRSVAVVTPETATKSTTTNRLASLLQDELALQGFQIKPIEEADLIVMATFSRTNIESSSFMGPTSLDMDPFRSSLTSINSRLTPNYSIANARDIAASTPKRKAGIIVTAFPRQSWLTAKDESTVRAWRVIAIMTQYNQTEDVLAKLVQGCGPTFHNLATAKQ